VYVPGGSSGTNFYSLTLSSGLVADAVNGNSLSLRLFAADSTVSYLFDSHNFGPGPAFHPFITVNASVVPEPGSLTLFTMAFAAFSMTRHFRRSRKRICKGAE